MLARDRLGIKPLYYEMTSERLRFASSMLPLLKGPDASAELSAESLNFYLNFHSIIPYDDAVSKRQASQAGRG